MKVLRRFWWLILLVVIGGAIFFGSRQLAQRKLKTETVRRGDVVEQLTLSGEIKAHQHVKLSFLAGGRLAWVGVAEGETVKKGQTLAYLDLSQLRTAVIAAENTYLAADVAAKKAEDDVKGHAADETFAQKNTRVAAQTARDTAYFQLQAARTALANTYLTAPFAGVVTYIAHPYPGINVTASETQIELLNPETIYFSVMADQSEVSRLQVGMNVSIILDSLDETEFSGKIDEIGLTPITDASGTVYEIKINFDQTPANLRVGMTGDVTLTIAKAENVLYVLPQFITANTTGKYLQTGPEKSDKLSVEIGVEGEDRVEITGGVTEGQTIYD